MKLDEVKKQTYLSDDRRIEINDNGDYEIPVIITIPPSDVMEHCDINEKQVKILIENYLDEPNDLIGYTYVMAFLRNGVFPDMVFDKDGEVNQIESKYGWNLSSDDRRRN